MKLNKQRQQMYLNGEVGIINTNDIDKLIEITNMPHLLGTLKRDDQYHPISWFYEEEVKRVKYGGTEYDVICETYPYYRLSVGVVKQSDCTPCDAPNEVNTELPKVGETWECVENLMHSGSMRFNKGKIYKSKKDGTLVCELGNNLYINLCIDYRSHFRKISQSNEVERTPIAYKLNIDIPEWKLKVGDVSICRTSIGYDFSTGCYITESILKHIATPIYTTKITLSNGQEVELTDEDIENIKKIK